MFSDIRVFQVSTFSTPCCIWQTLCSCIPDAVHEILPLARILPVLHFLSVRQCKLSSLHLSGPYPLLSLSISNISWLPRAKCVSPFTKDSLLPLSLTPSCLTPPHLSPRPSPAHKDLELATVNMPLHPEKAPSLPSLSFYTSTFS